MIYDTIELTKIAKELKFVRDTYEKVLRLTDVLYSIGRLITIILSKQ